MAGHRFTPKSLEESNMKHSFGRCVFLSVCSIVLFSTGCVKYIPPADPAGQDCVYEAGLVKNNCIRIAEEARRACEDQRRAEAIGVFENALQRWEFQYAADYDRYRHALRRYEVEARRAEKCRERNRRRLHFWEVEVEKRRAALKNDPNYQYAEPPKPREEHCREPGHRPCEEDYVMERPELDDFADLELCSDRYRTDRNLCQEEYDLTFLRCGGTIERP